LEIQAKKKKVGDSLSETIQIVLPNDTNMLGNLLGGTLMHWIDLLGATVANRHCRKPIVTASMEGLDFMAPIRLGHLVILKGRLQHVGHSSMEVGVEVFSEDGLSGERHHASSAILTYVAVDEAGCPIPVPELILSSDAEKRCDREAVERKRIRLARLGKKLKEE